MASPLDKQAPCPNCGAPMVFRFAAAKAQVCEHCRFVVARTGLNLTAVGKMADLVEIASPFTVGATGRWRGGGPSGGGKDEPFAVDGRVQFDRAGAPGAPWQETLISFPQSDKWVWLANAQGRWYAMTEVALPAQGVPHWKSLSPGRQISLGEYGNFTVAEVGQRRVVSGEGGLPHVAAPGQITRFADLGGPEGAFATIDYGDDLAQRQGASPPDTPRSNPSLFVGGQIDPSVVVLDSGAPVDAPEAKVETLACPKCGGNLPLVTPGTTERVVCRYCGTSSDLHQGALVAMAQAPKPPQDPEIPLGAEGNLRGKQVTCIGFMGRGTTVDGERYRWREYLLYAGASTGYLWLMEEDGNWSFVTPIPPGSAIVTGSNVSYQNQSYTQSQAVRAEVEYVVGEFYWRVEAGETVKATDYQGPGAIISVEEAPTEVTCSYCEKLPASEVGASFSLMLREGDGSSGGGDASNAPTKTSSTVKTIVICLIVFILIALWCAGQLGGGGGFVGGSSGGPHGPSFGGK